MSQAASNGSRPGSRGAFDGFASSLLATPAVDAES